VTLTNLDDLDLVDLLAALDEPARPTVVGRPFPTGPETETRGELVGVCGRCGAPAGVTANGYRWHGIAGGRTVRWIDSKVCP
jgi:hypothetical protein